MGRPPYKVAPYGSKGDINGAWEEEADEDTKELDEDFAPLVSTSKSQPPSQSWDCSGLQLCMLHQHETCKQSTTITITVPLIHLPIHERKLIRSQPRMSSKVTKKTKNPYGPSHPKLRIAGGRPAIAKKVTADLDSDDELIVRMKNAKYLEKDIAERLAKEGRIKYHPKTIGTRWARIKRKLQDFQDEMLDGDVTDWHEGDVSIVLQPQG